MATFPTITPGPGSTEGSYFMAMRFNVAAEQTITGIRFNSPGNQPATGVGLYQEGGSGAGLATKMQAFVAGWNTVTFDTPVVVTAGPNYVAGVLLPTTAGYTSVAQADVTEGDITSAHIGAFINPAPADLTFTVAPHWLGAADDGRLEDSGTSTWYGIQIVTDESVTLDPIAFTVERTSGFGATLLWGPLGDDPDGVTVLRAPGVHTTDGNGVAFGEVGYDPTTITGAVVVAEGQDSPYIDGGLDVDTSYTYAVIRTGPGA